MTDKQKPDTEGLNIDAVGGPEAAAADVLFKKLADDDCDFHMTFGDGTESLMILAKGHAYRAIINFLIQTHPSYVVQIFEDRDRAIRNDADKAPTKDAKGADKASDGR